MSQGQPYRVMLVDDSAVIRGLFKRWLEEDPEIQIIASANNGAVALRSLDREDPEVVILDIEMPEMDGITALPKMLEKRPDLKVIMASTLTRRNADISMKALEAGASDYIAKPTTSSEMHSAVDFRMELREKIKALGATIRSKKGESRPDRRAAAEARSSRQNEDVPKQNLYRDKSVSLRPGSKDKPEILAIGSSTGGPQALFNVFGALKGKLNVPVIITQHMPATFTAILAEHLTRVSGLQAVEASDGMLLEVGKIYVAPGNYHMVVVNDGVKKKLALNQDPPENFCRPAVDPMFRSVAALYGSRALTVILTGMGHDGLEGSRVITGKGGTLIAQDEESSVVWGMPGAVATAGLCTEVLPIDKVGPAIAKYLSGAA